MSFTTPNGKSISVVRNEKTAHLEIQFDSGGELPEALSGIYTSHTLANKAIERYLVSKEPKKA